MLSLCEGKYILTIVWGEDEGEGKFLFHLAKFQFDA